MSTGEVETIFNRSIEPVERLRFDPSGSEDE